MNEAYYIQYLLYPFLTNEPRKFNSPRLTAEASFSSLEGLDLTSATLKTTSTIWRVDNLRHSSPLVNMLIQLPTRTLPQMRTARTDLTAVRAVHEGNNLFFLVWFISFFFLKFTESKAMTI